MLRITLITSLVFGISLVGIGCGSDSSPAPVDEGDNSEAEVDDQDQKADAPATPVGTFAAIDPTFVTDEAFSLVALKTDKKFHAVKGISAVAVDGTYKFTKARNTSSRYIWFTTSTKKVRYEYQFSGLNLTLKASSKALPQEFVRSNDAWCGEPADCKIQNLPQPKCPGEWGCESNVCKYSECGQPSNKPPVCDGVGSRGEGWYDADGLLICWAKCGGANPECKLVGSDSQGWYSSSDTGCGSGGLIKYSAICESTEPVNSAPICGPKVITSSGHSPEGWFKPDGTLICEAKCVGATAECKFIESDSQGWYSSSGTACGTGGLIEYSSTCRGAAGK